MIEIIKNNKLNVSLAGGVLVLATAYGTCTVDPNEEAIKQAVEEKVEEKTEEKIEEKTEEAPAKPVEEPQVEAPAVVKE